MTASSLSPVISIGHFALEVGATRTSCISFFAYVFWGLAGCLAAPASSPRPSPAAAPPPEACCAAAVLSCPWPLVLRLGVLSATHNAAAPALHLP